MNSSPDPRSCKPTPCSCSGSLPRRDFIVSSSLATVGLALGRFPAIAGPFDPEEFHRLIPADKKLDPAWVQSLYCRGEPTVYRGSDLETIGMPIGGITTGQLYLGGDGRLWHWDIFNLPQADKFTSSSGPNYARPPRAESPIEQGFAIKITANGQSQTRPLDARGFNPKDITFRGQYPMAWVDYIDNTLPVTVCLEAFSPFIPLNVPDSSLPATILRYTLRNTSPHAVEVEIGGWLENGVCLNSAQSSLGRRRNRIHHEDRLTFLECSAEALPENNPPARRPDILFEDFENGYGKWTVQGEAFGREPASGTLPNQQSVTGFQGQRLVNTFLRGDVTQGRLISPVFPIERRFITFLIGGGNQTSQTCFNLLVDGRVVRTATGQNLEQLRATTWNVDDLQGRQAQLEIVDQATGGWGHINVDQIVFSDQPAIRQPLTEQDDFGTMGLALLADDKEVFAQTNLAGDPATSIFARTNLSVADETAQPFNQRLIGGLSQRMILAAGAQAKAVFVVTWHFPRLMSSQLSGLIDFNRLRRSYVNRFATARAVASYIVKNFARLTEDTRLWNRTWYDATLPYWFLDRTFIPICTLATNTCYLFNTGRFYAFEGVLCCQGTCQHVWNYAQAVARVFPELERDLRQRTDFGTAWHENGAIDYRGEFARHVAHDGQCGVILRAWREHLTSPTSQYLNQCWPRIRKSIEFLIGCDRDENGLLEGEQYNTLDASWWGPMAWISSLYIAALRAGEAMATEMNDAAFAARCRTLAERGSDLLIKTLYNGEYFFHKPDPNHPEGTNTNKGCHIDQLMGQAWALQVGLPRIVPVPQALSALEAIWKYNFTLDAGGYRDAMQPAIKGGRWYAMPGEGGVVMTTFPQGGAAASNGKGGFAFYFNEVWTGQEHQLAAHMMWEGLVEKALIITRVLHDRHHAARRNPYNEIECSDHYARAMSSFGTFLAACGFECHSPNGYLGFSPRLTPSDFRAPFVAAEGWGTFLQKANPESQTVVLSLRWGQLRLKKLALSTAESLKPGQVTVSIGDQSIRASLSSHDSRIEILLEHELTLRAGDELKIALR
ncbi:MAG TPA: GH116 family glycosyl hydrolase [Candidatus Paceibacterota bacterium]|nr:GH116 family glycosyl hydrolase [Candidatus Paceibacterota bacterium]